MAPAKQVTEGVLDTLAKEYYTNDDVKDHHLENFVKIQSAPLVTRYIPEGARVIEMGVGDAVMTPEFMKYGIKPDIVEGSGILVKNARAKFPGLTVIHSMFETFVPEAPYDVALCLHTLEHVDDVPDLLGHARSWLKEGGIMIAIVPNAESIHRQLAVTMGLQKKNNDLSARDHMVGHLRVYTMDELRRDFEISGFRIEDEFGYFLKTLPNSMMLDYSDALLEGLCRVSSVPARLLANIGVCARKVGT